MAQTELAGRVVVITGGARGIGAATAHAFAKAGATVAIGDRDEALARSTAAEIAPSAGGYSLDVTDPAVFAAFLDRVEADLGPIDVLVNNAGIMPVTPFAEETTDSIRRQLAINVEGVINGCQLAIRLMRPRGSGQIVNIASAAGKIAFSGVATYSATKFAVVGLTEALALEYKDSGIGFTCVMPGLVKTELASGLEDHWLLKKVEPEDIADAIVSAVRDRQREVYLPKRLVPMTKAFAVLPKSLGSWVMTALGADHQILDGANAVGRSAYDNRIGTRS